MHQNPPCFASASVCTMRSTQSTEYGFIDCRIRPRRSAGSHSARKSPRVKFQCALRATPAHRRPRSPHPPGKRRPPPAAAQAPHQNHIQQPRPPPGNPAYRPCTMRRNASSGTRSRTVIPPMPMSAVRRSAVAVMGERRQAGNNNFQRTRAEQQVERAATHSPPGPTVATPPPSARHQGRTQCRGKHFPVAFDGNNHTHEIFRGQPGIRAGEHYRLA